jgi:hypothetical protein
MPRTTRLAVLAALVLFPLAAAAGAQSFEVSGRFEYEDKAWDYDGWTGERPALPIRRADVSVLIAGTSYALGLGSTGEDGSFSIPCTASGPVDIEVRCEADTSRSTGLQRLRVTTPSGSEYASLSPVFRAHDPHEPLDIGTVSIPPATVGTAEGHPFNLLDVGVHAFEYLTGPEAGASPLPYALRFVWPNPGGSFAVGSTANIADDDGYDDCVALHELGHLVLLHWSDDDSPGGQHDFGDSDQEPRLAFTEGFATLFGGLVLDALGLEALYVDCSGSAQAGGVQLRLRLESVAPWAGECFGEADEVAVACALFDVLDDELAADGTPGRDDDEFVLGTTVKGLPAQAAWWALVTGPLVQVANLALQDAWDQWLALYSGDAQLRELAEAFEARCIRFVPDLLEPDGAPSIATPAQAVWDFSWPEARTLYAPADGEPAPGSGDVDHHAVQLVAGDVIEVRTRYPLGAFDAETECDPYVELYDPTGMLVAADENSGAGRNALLPSVAIPTSGAWVVKVGTHSTLRRYGRYELRIQYLSQNHAPVLVSGPTAFPPAVLVDESAQLSALARDEDGDALAYDWVPLDGGSIHGSGPSVMFLPPPVTVTTAVRVRLVVSDSLGAQTEPADVIVTVLPEAGGLCTGAASWELLGTGKPGLGGTPALAGVGLPVVPGAGFAMRATGLTPLLPGFVVFGFTQLGLPLDGGTLWPSPELLLPVTPDDTGSIVIPLLLPAEPLLCGVTVLTQVIVPDDPGAAGAQQTAQSNGLKITFGD